MKTCFIYQPSGVGDILFTQKIAQHYKNQGFKIVWPLYEYVSWMKEYLPSDGISYPILSNDRKILEPFEHSDRFYYLMGSTYALFRKPVIALDFIYISCGPATLVDNEMMTAKYSVADVDYDNWQSFVNLQRNTTRENELYYNVLGLKDDTKYTLINEYCSSHKIDIDPVGNSVYMQTIPGFTVLDWIKVIENCQRMITIDTSLPHIAEIYLPKNIPCHLLNRYDPPSFVDLPKIFKLNWQYCITTKDIII